MKQAFAKFSYIILSDEDHFDSGVRWWIHVPSIVTYRCPHVAKVADEFFYHVHFEILRIIFLVDMDDKLF